MTVCSRCKTLPRVPFKGETLCRLCIRQRPIPTGLCETVSGCDKAAVHTYSGNGARFCEDHWQALIDAGVM